MAFAERELRKGAEEEGDKTEEEMLQLLYSIKRAEEQRGEKVRWFSIFFGGVGACKEKNNCPIA